MFIVGHVRARCTSLLIVVTAGVACVGESPRAASPTTTPAPHAQAAPALDRDVADVVEKILSSAEHPGLTGASIPDVVADLRPLYDAEPDRLLWFDGARPVRAAEATVAAVAAAAESTASIRPTTMCRCSWISGAPSGPDHRRRPIARVRRWPQRRRRTYPACCAQRPRRSRDDELGIHDRAEAGRFRTRS